MKKFKVSFEIDTTVSAETYEDAIIQAEKSIHNNRALHIINVKEL